MARAKCRLSLYGERLADYRGRGELRYADGSRRECSFRAAQLTNGAIVVETQSRQASPDDAAELVGQTGEGADFHAVLAGYSFSSHSLSRKNTSARWSTQWDAYWYARRITVRHRTRRKPLRLTMGLVNFEFAENRRERTKSAVRPDHLAVGLPLGNVTFTKVANYDEVLSRLRYQRGVDLTCHASMEISKDAKLEDHISTMDDVCKLLSLARGTKVNWIYHRSLDRRGQAITTVHENKVTKPFGVMQLIDSGSPSDTVAFLDSTLPVLQRDTTYDLGRAIDGYLDAKGRGFLETRGVAACVMLDFLLSRYSSGPPRRDRIVSSARRFRNGAATLKADLPKYFPSLDNEQLEDMTEKIAELNRRAFKTVLREFCDSLGLGIGSAAIERVKDIRNKLVHEARFLNDEKYWRQYLTLVHLLDRVMLRILDYRGPYLDCTQQW